MTKKSKSTSKVIKFAVIADHHIIEDGQLVDCPGNGTEIEGLFDTKAAAKKFVKKSMKEYAEDFNEYFGAARGCDNDDECNLELDFDNMCIIDHDAHASIHEWHIQQIEL